MTGHDRILRRAVHVVRTYAANPALVVTLESRRFVPAVEMLREALRDNADECSALGLDKCEHDDIAVCCEKCAPALVKAWEEDQQEEPWV